MLLFPRWKEICSTPLSQCNRIGEEFNWSRKTMPGSDGVDTPGRSYWSESKSGWGSPDAARKVSRWNEDGNLSESYESYGNAGGRICHPMVVGEMWLPHTAIRRRQETLPSVLHPTAPEPLMLHSARDEKGKAQESIGSWAFPKNYITLNPSSSPRPS